MNFGLRLGTWLGRNFYGERRDNIEFHIWGFVLR